MKNIDIEPSFLSPFFVNILRFVIRLTRLNVVFLDSYIDCRDGNILVFNHLSHIETVFLPVLLNKKTGLRFYSLMHHSFFYNRLVNWFNRRVWYCISTSDEDKYLKMIKAIVKNHNVIIYPQGSICKKDEQLSSKTGPAYLATLIKKWYPNTEVRIIPARITYDPLDYSSNWLSRLTGLSEMETNAMLKKTKVTVMTGRPILIEDVPETEIERLDYIARIRDRYHNFITGKVYRDIAEWREDNPLTKNEIAREKALLDAWIAENPGRSTEVQKDYRDVG